MNIMAGLDKHIGKTIYLTGYTVQSDECTDATIDIFVHKKDILKHLERNSASNLGDLTLLHGTLTKACSIPNNLNDNMDIFLIIPYATSDLDSFIIQCCTMDYLQKVVTSIITQNVNTEDDLDDLIDDIINLDIQNIENLYILYGYEIELKYSFSDDDVDEEILEEAKKMFKKIESRQTK